ncbi:MAG: hypothetical protein ACLP01_28775 [Solirubrobacteraceae bacterium]
MQSAYKHRATTSTGTVVEIACHACPHEAEGIIQQIARSADQVEIDLLLSDGTHATARLGALEWTWLELRVSDIVPVRVHAGLTSLG